MSWLTMPPGDIAPTVAAVAVTYAVVVVLGRLVGVRSFSQMSTFDFTLTLAIASVFAATAADASLPVSRGAAALATLFALQYGGAALRRWGWGSKALDNRPVLLVLDGVIVDEGLASSRVTRADLRAALRTAGVRSISEVAIAAAETTGSISVVTSSPDTPVDAWIVEDLV